MHSQSFINNNFLFLITVESAALQVFLQLPKQMVCQESVNFQHDNATPHHTHTQHVPDTSSCSCLLWMLLDHPSSCLGFCSDMWEVTNSTTIGKWKWLFMSGCECMSPIFTVTEFLNSGNDGTDSSVLMDCGKSSDI